LVVTAAVIFIMLVFSSGFMFYVENSVQPEAFRSIPEAMWWGTATLTSVGYGDVYPITSLGKFLGAIVSFSGIILFAIPTGILATGFAEEMKLSRVRDGCPHCGKEIKI